MTAQHHPSDDPAAHDRSGGDVEEAVRVAEQGTGIQDVHTLPGAPGSAPVERTAGDPEMTEGQVVLGADDETAQPTNPDPAAAGSGGAQSIVGARASDRVAADEPLPDSPPYTG